ncbi:DNA mismatch repair protein MutL [Paenibacillus cellulosilyticus]|uniref:DNA mismatch repair protein MutL n=1 Tax=Paenibacillus cellulosilyticus TaxID=375489 RepID=A0A2V2YV51_9BACL|nr:DNA mismatch repair endonuclease MutL [Paenibacillus cellulosilyticus]PWW00659.1 DNA mismatch repair protein MutL [Paenibacillus cellulosilyticus]QKS45524.1 DNA mismatch repair endonuclease MutL [Paenibacillus cellulosilyticus]
MATIRVLDEQLANQIAAGEVVERPASVVKELVENAVDAGATTIDLTIEEGGLNLIRVIDNGSGIQPDEVETAFQRHATSKLLSSADLFRIASLGFRGEALPSIAAVARVECISSPTADGLGYRLVIEGGTIKHQGPVNSQQGTEMSVRDLFYNTPARLKYMKSIQTELGHISDYMNRIALAHPGIAFTLRHNGNELLRTPGTGDRLQVIAAVYGTSAAKAMLPISAETPDYNLNGYISKPDLTRANRNAITIVVNGRYIRSFLVNQALLQGYHTLLPINRYPLVALEIGMHPSLLDVNVHPSKMEVRFSKEPELRALIEQAVRKVLGRDRYIPEPAADKEERSKPVYVQERIAFHRPEPGFPTAPAASPSNSGIGSSSNNGSGLFGGRAFSAPSTSGPFARPSGAGSDQIRGASGLANTSQPNQRSAFSSTSRASSEGWRNSSSHLPERREQVPHDATERLYAPGAKAGDAIRESSASDDADFYAPAPVEPSATEDSSNVELVAGEGVDTVEALAASARQAAAASTALQPQETVSTAMPDYAANSTDAAPEAPFERDPDTPPFPELSWIGQLHGTYLIAQSEDGLYMIDQHAAHERINYEYYVEKFGRPQQASQPLLIPITLEMTAGDAVQLQDKLELLRQVGLDLEPFGAKTFLVRSHPEWLPVGDEQSIIEEMIEWVLQEKRNVDIQKLREKSAIMCSCKASIKANQRLTREESEVLLARLGACRQPYTCPHGRPIVVHISTYQLEKMFKRVMS